MTILATQHVSDVNRNITPKPIVNLMITLQGCLSFLQVIVCWDLDINRHMFVFVGERSMSLTWIGTYCFSMLGQWLRYTRAMMLIICDFHLSIHDTTRIAHINTHIIMIQEWKLYPLHWIISSSFSLTPGKRRRKLIMWMIENPIQRAQDKKFNEFKG